MTSLENYTLFIPEKAKELAEKLNNDFEDDFSYIVVNAPSGIGLAFISIYDNKLKLLGRL